MSPVKEGPLGAFEVAECPGCGGAVTWAHYQDIVKEARDYMRKMGDDEQERLQAWAEIERARKEVARERAEVERARAELASTRPASGDPAHEAQEAHAECPVCRSTITPSQHQEIVDFARDYKRRVNEKVVEVAREIVAEYGDVERQRTEIAREREGLAAERRRLAEGDPLADKEGT